GSALENLARMTLTPDELAFAQSGVTSRRQFLEGSAGFRLAYHGFRELGATGSLFSDAVDADSGTYWLTAHRRDGSPALRIAVPAPAVERVRELTEPSAVAGGRLPVRLEPLDAYCRVESQEGRGLALRLAVPASEATSPRLLLDPLRGEFFRFGKLVYLPQPRVFARLAEPEPLARRLLGGVVATVGPPEVPAFLADVEGASYLLDAADQPFRVHRQVDQVEVFAHALERSWLWISVRYGLGSSSVSLEDVLRARAEGKAFVEVGDRWLDCRSPDLGDLDAWEGRALEPGGGLRVSRAECLQLSRRAQAPVTVAGKEAPAEHLRRFLDLSPAGALPELKGLASTLRPYQRRGAEWLVFLHENGLGGLLCDDMGLGKTHQVMALLVYLREHAGVEEPFLVVCPATVLSHWSAKLRDFAPGMPVVLHHGGERDLEAAWKAGGVVLTSYGVLRNDAPFFAEAPFSLAVFDEAQHLKNRSTLAHEAARDVEARMKLAVTGTPVENSLTDLKALVDLTVPGYLGSDREFLARYEAPAEPGLRSRRRAELARLVSPFTLRRLKQSVLDELPDKIEDLRTCALSDEQVRLYREALRRRSPDLLAALGHVDQAVPYVHVFALLSLLKQICDHPALLQPTVEGYERHDSGKWDLFAELLSESLDSGQKVVVFTHFLGMIEIMERHLKGQGVGYAALTGKSRNRGKLIERFHEDPDCRVFLASLKAGGAGIDLVAGSVVIHYDRWWNAAAEDQATDRVHRIGQTRGVQVFKLVTEGTLEEKIAAIIERKRALLRDVVAEDEPGLLKAYSREEILEMLEGPR
ncbi:MAG: DEAD/DEAH box helicase, partial [Deltaproteobacteria bacterium]|nr:DEAD/DEAH box helicase [Deltaproteobacteria bacterium]